MSARCTEAQAEIGRGRSGTTHTLSKAIAHKSFTFHTRPPWVWSLGISSGTAHYSGRGDVLASRYVHTYKLVYKLPRPRSWVTSGFSRYMLTER